LSEIQPTRMWADAQRDGRPAEYRWRPDLCESSVIPFLVPRHKVWLTPSAGVPCSITLPIYDNARLRRKVYFARGENPSGCKSHRKCIYDVAAQETAYIVQSLVGLR